MLLWSVKFHVIIAVVMEIPLLRRAGPCSYVDISPSEYSVTYKTSFKIKKSTLFPKATLYSSCFFLTSDKHNFPQQQLYDLFFSYCENNSSSMKQDITF
jgi:hypothetical protein